MSKMLELLDREARAAAKGLTRRGDATSRDMLSLVPAS
jgi:hypothetical protein